MTARNNWGRSGAAPAESQAAIHVRPVGVIKNDVRSPALIANKDGLRLNTGDTSSLQNFPDPSEEISEIVIHEEFSDLLYGIDEYSHLVVLYWGHEVSEEARSLRRIHPAGLDQYPAKGIYATYSPARPNPVLMTVVRLQGRFQNRLIVSGLDAIDKSPVIDIKPYVRDVFLKHDCSIPDWMQEIMQEFEEESKIRRNRMKQVEIDEKKTPIAPGFPDTEKFYENPRRRVIEAIKKRDATSCLLKTAEIHGHYCPGSALGVMASLYGMSLLQDNCLDSDGIMEDLLAIVEVNACFADGIQAVSGCTFGNNSLIYRDLGKHAVTFALRGTETGIRVRVRPEFSRYVDEAAPDFYPLLQTVIVDRAGTAEEEKRFREAAREAAFALITIPFEKVLDAQVVTPDIPGYAPITESVVCPGCRELVMATKIRTRGLQRGKCFMCSQKYMEVEGRGIVERDLRKNENKN